MIPSANDHGVARNNVDIVFDACSSKLNRQTPIQMALTANKWLKPRSVTGVSNSQSNITLHPDSDHSVK